jgi:hypothetical protein
MAQTVLSGENFAFARWKDNDQYLHMNNAVYHGIFDSGKRVWSKKNSECVKEPEHFETKISFSEKYL